MLKFYWLEYTNEDHPNKYSLVLYTKWCNLRCFGCHNRKLAWWDYDDSENISCNICENQINHVNVEDHFNELTEEEIRMALSSGLLDMIIFCGWEFLVNSVKQIKETIDFVRSIDSSLLIRIDTNGSFPEKMKELVEEWYVDGFAIDIKWPYWNSQYHDKISDVMWLPQKAAESLFPRMIDSLEISKKLEFTIYRTVLYPMIEDNNYFEIIKEYTKSKLNKPHYFNEFTVI